MAQEGPWEGSSGKDLDYNGQQADHEKAVLLPCKESQQPPQSGRSIFPYPAPDMLTTVLGCPV